MFCSDENSFMIYVIDRAVSHSQVSSVFSFGEKFTQKTEREREIQLNWKEAVSELYNVIETT